MDDSKKTLARLSASLQQSKPAKKQFDPQPVVCLPVQGTSAVAPSNATKIQMHTPKPRQTSFADRCGEARAYRNQIGTLKPPQPNPAAVNVPKPSHSASLQDAQRCVGAAMGTCLALWFAPLISGLAVNKAESAMVAQILKKLDCYSDTAVDSVFWFVRKKMLILNIATYTPFAGVPLQLFETYALGQFTMHCATRPERLTDESWMAANWCQIQDQIFSGCQAIRSYEQFTGETFPDFARPAFIKAVDLISKTYWTAERVPGLAKAQEVTGQFVREGILVGKWAAAGLVSRMAKAAERLCSNVVRDLEKRGNR